MVEFLLTPWGPAGPNLFLPQAKTRPAAGAGAGAPCAESRGNSGKAAKVSGQETYAKPKVYEF